MKTLNQFLEQTGYLRVKSPDEQKFVDKHVVQVTDDKNGNNDDVFKAAKVKKLARRAERHGYDTDEDEAVYEEIEALDELSKDTMLKYLSANKKSGARGGRDTIKRMRGADMAVRKYTARDNKYIRVPATEEVETLDEISAEKKDAYAQKAGNQLSGLFKKSSSDADASRKYYNRKNTVRKIANEEVDLDEKKLTPAEMKKREEVAKAIKRDNPRMPMAKKMAIATATAKKVAEDFEEAIADLHTRAQDIMVETFERLNEENKQKFVTACQTEEGLEKMVAFAIENRGK